MLSEAAFLVLCFFLIAATASKKPSWNYADKGPKEWPKIFPTCNGENQSPINIEPEKAWFDKSLTAFEMEGYDSIPTGANWKLTNTGHSVRLVFTGNYRLSDGGLNGIYQPAFMEFHWGKAGRKGSEHTFNKKSSGLEVQIHHFNAKYKTYEAAVNVPEGIAVLAFIFDTDPYENMAYHKVFGALPNISHVGDWVDLRPMPLLSMLPVNLNDYYRYHGSLTTPPCSENVIWSIFSERLTLSKQQLEGFRQWVHTSAAKNEGKDTLLTANVRPTQKLNSRTIYSSNPDHATWWSHPFQNPMSITFACFFGIVIILLLTKPVEPSATEEKY